MKIPQHLKTFQKRPPTPCDNKIPEAPPLAQRDQTPLIKLTEIHDKKEAESKIEREYSVTPKFWGWLASPLVTTDTDRDI